MKTYNEITHEEMQDPDLSLGYTYPGQRFVAHHDAVAEQYHYAVMNDTESMRKGKGLRTKVIDVPAREAWDEYEDCLYYRPYTEEELAERDKPGVEERLAAAEAAIMELAYIQGGEN